METLDLLAVCHRKSGDLEKALDVYDRIISIGSPAEQNRARFRAGVILQDHLGRHSAAIRRFDEYLEETGDRRPNAAEAKMRLAKSVKRTEDMRLYEQILRSFVKEHGGTQAAEKAGAELEGLR